MSQIVCTHLSCTDLVDIDGFMVFKYKTICLDLYSTVAPADCLGLLGVPDCEISLNAPARSAGMISRTAWRLSMNNKKDWPP
jgi:hypothetical protein